MQKPKVVDGATPGLEFQDSSTEEALDGTIVRAEFQNDNFGNLFKLVENTGESLVDDDLEQISKAVVKQSLAGFYTDSGSVNNIELTNSAINGEALFDGMTILFTPANVNTGATTLKVKTLAAKDLKYNGLALTADFLQTDSKYIAIYSVANNRFDVDLSVNKKNLEDSASSIRLNNADERYSGQPAGEEILKNNGDNIASQFTASATFDAVSSGDATILESQNVSRVQSFAAPNGTSYRVYFEDDMDTVNYTVGGGGQANGTNVMSVCGISEEGSYTPQLDSCDLMYLAIDNAGVSAGSRLTATFKGGKN